MWREARTQLSWELLPREEEDEWREEARGEEQEEMRGVGGRELPIPPSDSSGSELRDAWRRRRRLEGLEVTVVMAY